MRSRTLSILMALGLAGLLVLVGLVLLVQEPRAVPEPTPTSDPLEAPLARVNGQPISVGFWAEQHTLELVIAQVTGNSAPAPRATLDRLINETLALEAYPQREPSRAAVAARLAALQAAWNLDAVTLDERLAQAQLSRAHFEATVRRLLMVEAAQQQITAEHELAAWIDAAREAADVWIDGRLLERYELAGE